MFLWRKMDVEECLHRLAEVWRAKWGEIRNLGKQQTNNLPIDHGRDGCIVVTASSLLRNVSKIYFRHGQSNFPSIHFLLVWSNADFQFWQTSCRFYFPINMSSPLDILQLTPKMLPSCSKNQLFKFLSISPAQQSIDFQPKILSVLDCICDKRLDTDRHL